MAGVERSARNPRNQEVHARKDPRAIQEIKKFTRATQKGRGKGGWLAWKDPRAIQEIKKFTLATQKGRGKGEGGMAGHTQQLVVSAYTETRHRARTRNVGRVRVHACTVCEQIV